LRGENLNFECLSGNKKVRSDGHSYVNYVRNLGYPKQVPKVNQARSCKDSILRINNPCDSENQMGVLYAFVYTLITVFFGGAKCMPIKVEFIKSQELCIK